MASKVDTLKRHQRSNFPSLQSSSRIRIDFILCIKGKKKVLQDNFVLFLRQNFFLNLRVNEKKSFCAQHKVRDMQRINKHENSLK